MTDNIAWSHLWINFVNNSNGTVWSRHCVRASPDSLDESITYVLISCQSSAQAKRLGLSILHTFTGAIY